jgi:hypothetical protein
MLIQQQDQPLAEDNLVQMLTEHNLVQLLTEHKVAIEDLREVLQNLNQCLRPKIQRLQRSIQERK